MNILKGLLLFSLVAVFILPQSSSAASEEHFTKIYDLLQNGEGTFYWQKTFTAKDGLEIAFTKFGEFKGKNGSVVILPGRTESSLKYIEVAYDLTQRGFSPIYVLDHRGQGFSDRQLADPHKGYVSDFADYTADVERFVEIVFRDSSLNSNRTFLLSHSMGGSILVNFLQTTPHRFKAAALIAPMFKIANSKSEDLILNETFLACYVLQSCKDYIPGGGPFRWESRKFEGNDLTHSHTRFSLRDHLWRKWPQLQLGDPTIRWVREAVQNNVEQRKQDHLSRIHLPLRIYQAEKDRVVKNSAQSEVCRKIGKNCQLFIAKGAKHEILMETDRIRNAVLKHIEAFFLKTR